MEDDNTIIADSFIKLNIRQKGNKQTRSVYLSDLVYLVTAKLQVAANANICKQFGNLGLQ